MALIGITPELYSIHTNLNLLYQFWIHTKAIGKFPRWIEYIFNTPSHHRVHHARNAKYIDKNYAGTLIIFDRIYGTFVEEAEEPTYGLVHPVESFNPIVTQFHVTYDVLKNAWYAKSWKQKWQALFKGPGFDVVSQTYFPFPDCPPPEKVKKYDPLISARIRLYGLAQFVIAFTVAVLFMFDEKSSYMASFTQGVYIYYSFASVGALFDSYLQCGLTTESIRVILTAIACYGFDRFWSNAYLLPLPIFNLQPLGISLAQWLLYSNILSVILLFGLIRIEKVKQI